jgi:hypothetical protein
MAHYTAAMALLFLIIITCSLLMPVAAHAELAPSATTQVVLLGTGTPNAEPQRSGPAVAADATVEKYAKNADILIHDVYSVEGFQNRDSF